MKTAIITSDTATCIVLVATEIPVIFVTVLVLLVLVILVEGVKGFFLGPADFDSG